MKKITLKRTKKSHRAEQGHPWVFSGEVDKTVNSGYNGKAVQCYDSRNHFLGSGIYNTKSKIIWRRFSFEVQEFNKIYLEKAIDKAVNKREKRDFRRLIWSESDSIPGLVVDQYQDIIVVQALTMAVNKKLTEICTILQDKLNPSEIVIRNDAKVRLLEGLSLETKTISGNSLPVKTFDIEGIKFELDLEKGQKTGFYLDQYNNYKTVASYAKDKKVLDAFCNQGAFSLYCKKAGASSVTSIDSSEDSIKRAKKNADLNKLDINFVNDNVFDYFSKIKDEKWDIIILDPPPFAKSKKNIAGALRGYKEINLRALKALNPGGILVTFSCSHHISHEIFNNMLIDAASDAKRNACILEFCNQPKDHPILLSMPESEYLRGVILGVD